MYSPETIKSVLLRLKSENFRNGFNNTVIHQIQDEIIKVHSFEDSIQFQKDFACMHYSVRVMASVNQLVEQFDQELIDLYIEVSELAQGPGSFQMPSWGTYGS